MLQVQQPQRQASLSRGDCQRHVSEEPLPVADHQPQSLARTAAAELERRRVVNNPDRPLRDCPLLRRSHVRRQDPFGSHLLVAQKPIDSLELRVGRDHLWEPGLRGAHRPLPKQRQPARQTRVPQLRPAQLVPDALRMPAGLVHPRKRSDPTIAVKM